MKQRSYLALTGGGLYAAVEGVLETNTYIYLNRHENTPNIVKRNLYTAEFYTGFFSVGTLLYFTGIKSQQISLGLIIGGLSQSIRKRGVAHIHGL